MAKGFGISALVLAILSAFAAYGFNFFSIWFAMICAAIAALNGERPFTIASFVISLAGLLLFSPLTMGVITVNLKGGENAVAVLAFAPFLLPIIAVVVDTVRKGRRDAAPAAMPSSALSAPSPRAVRIASVVGGVVVLVIVAGYFWVHDSRPENPAQLGVEMAKNLLGETSAQPAQASSTPSVQTGPSSSAPEPVQAPPPQAEPAQGNPLVMHLSFDRDYSDDSGFGNNGIPRGQIAFIPGYAPPSGRAVKYEDVNSAIVVEPSSSLDFQDRLSVSLWFKPDTMQRSPWPVLFYKAGENVSSPSVNFSDRVVTLAFRQTGIAASYTFAGDMQQTNCSNPTIGLTPDTWHNLVFTFNTSAGTARVYVDNILQAECTFAPGRLLRQGNKEIGIGGPINAQLGDTSNFNGPIDSVRIYHAALSEPEIAAIYNGRE